MQEVILCRFSLGSVFINAHIEL